MEIILEKDTELKDLETKINGHLRRLEDEGNAIKGITYAVESVPTLRGGTVTGHKVEYSVMVAYTPFMGV